MKHFFFLITDVFSDEFLSGSVTDYRTRFASRGKTLLRDIIFIAKFSQITEVSP